jgi:hypothetical protein
MNRVAILMCLVCLPAFSQDAPGRNLDLYQYQGKMGPAGVMLRRAESLDQISKAIDRHQSFRLPDNSFGPAVTATATGFVRNGDALILIGVEITTSSIVVTADEAIYDWDTRQIEPRGNVRLRSVTPH